MLGRISTSNPVNKAHPLNQGRVSWWLALPHLAAGPILADLMGFQAMNLTSMTRSAGTGWAPTTRPGGFAELDFNSSMSSSATPAQTATQPSPPPGPFAAAIWANAASGGSGPLRAFAWGYQQQNICWIISYDYGTSAWKAEWDIGSFNSSEASGTTGRWYRLLMIYTGYDVRLYLNGQHGFIAGGVSGVSTNGQSVIGIGCWSYGSPFLGALDDATYWFGNSLASADPDAFAAMDYSQSIQGYPDALNRRHSERVLLDLQTAVSFSGSRRTAQMGGQIQQGQTTQPLPFLLISSSDHISPVTGATPTVAISKAGAAFAAPSGAVSQVGNGWYAVAGNSADSNTPGPLVLHASATGTDPTDVVFEVVGYNPLSATLGLATADGTCQAGTTTTATLALGQVPVAVGSTLNFVAGTGAGQTAVVASYNATTRVATFTTPVLVAPDSTTQYNVLPVASVNLIEINGSVVSGNSIGGGDSMVLSWDSSFTQDNTINSVTIINNHGMAGDLVSLSGKAAINYTFSIRAQSGQPFNPGTVFVGIVSDIDGTNYQSPPNLIQGQIPSGSLFTPGSTDPTPVANYYGSRIYESQLAAGVRFYVFNNSGIPVVATVNYKRA